MSAATCARCAVIRALPDVLSGSVSLEIAIGDLASGPVDYCACCAAVVTLERERNLGVPAGSFCPRHDAPVLRRAMARFTPALRDAALLLAMVAEGRIVLRACAACSDPAVTVPATDIGAQLEELGTVAYGVTE